MTQITALDNAEWMTDEIRDQLKPYIEKGYVYCTRVLVNSYPGFEEIDIPNLMRIPCPMEGENEYKRGWLFLLQSKRDANWLVSLSETREEDDRHSGTSINPYGLGNIDRIFAASDHEFILHAPPDVVLETLNTISKDRQTAKLILSWVLAACPQLTPSDLEQIRKQNRPHEIGRDIDSRFREQHP